MHHMVGRNLLEKLCILRAVDVLGKRDGFDRHAERNLMAVHAFDFFEAGLVRNEL